VHCPEYEAILKEYLIRISIPYTYRMVNLFDSSTTALYDVYIGDSPAVRARLYQDCIRLWHKGSANVLLENGFILHSDPECFDKFEASVKMLTLGK